MARQDEEIRFSLIDGVTKGLKVIGDNLSKIGEAGTHLNQTFELVGKGIEAVEKVGELFKVPVEQAASFEAAIQRVAAYTGSTAEEFAALKRVASDASQSFGIPVEEAAGALENLARNGLSASDAVGALAPALRLARDAGLETQVAAGILGDTMDQFGISANRAAEITDILVTAAQSAGTGVGQLADAFQTAAPAASLAGASLKETSAALGLLAQSGVEGARAGKGLVQIFTQLADPASTLRDDLRGAGVDATKFADVIEVLSKDGDLAARVYSDLGPKVGPILQAAVRQGSGSLAELAAKLDQSSGSAAKLSEEIGDTFEESLKQLKQSIAAIERDIGEPLLAPLKDALKTLEGAVRDVAASPEFGKFKEVLTQAIQEAAAALRQFLKDLDFTQVKQAISDFAAHADENFAKVRDVAGDVLTALKATFEALRVLFNVLDASISTTVAALAEMQAIGASFAAPFSKEADALSQKLQNIANAAAGRVVPAMKGAGTATGAFIDVLADAGKKAEPAARTLQSASTGAQATGTASADAAPKVVALAEGLKQIPAPAQEAGKETEQTAVYIGHIADKAEKAAESTHKVARAVTVTADEMQAAQQAVTDTSAAYAELIRQGDATPEALQAANDAWVAATKKLDGLQQAQGRTKTQSKELTDAFHKLGITSEAELVEKVNKAAASLDEIAAAQKAGTVSTYELQQAFNAYAEAVRAAEEHAEPAQRAQLERQLQIKAATLGLTATIQQMGQTGASAGDALVTASNDAATALEQVATAADDAGGSVENFAAATNRAADATAAATDEMSGTSTTITGVSEEFAKAANRLNTLARQTFFVEDFNRLADMYARQTNELNRQVDALKKQNQQYDDMAKRVDALHKQFRTLGDEQLRQLAEQQQQFEERQKRAQEDLQRQRDELERQKQQQAADTVKQQTGNTSGAGLGGGAPSTVVNLHLHGIIGDEEIAKRLARPLETELKRIGLLRR